jgi:hypothetical protein
MRKLASGYGYVKHVRELYIGNEQSFASQQTFIFAARY